MIKPTISNMTLYLKLYSTHIQLCVLPDVQKVRLSVLRGGLVMAVIYYGKV